MKDVNLEGLVLVHVIGRSWGGKVKVSRETDLAKAKADLPPCDVLVDGQKCLVSPKTLTKFNTMYNQLKAVFALKGFPFLGGYAIKHEDAKALFAEADDIRDRYMTAADEFVASLDVFYDEHEAKNPEWAHILRPARLPAGNVRSRFMLSYLPFKPGPVSSNPADPLNTNFTSHASRALYALLEDVAKDARDLIKQSFIDKATAAFKDRVTQKAVNPVRELIAKLDAFAFMDPAIYPAVQALEAKLDQLPRTGPLTAVDVVRVVGVLETMSDPDDVLALQAPAAAAATQVSLPLAASTPPPAPAPVATPVPAATTNATESHEEASAIEPMVESTASVPADPIAELVFDDNW